MATTISAPQRAGQATAARPERLPSRAPAPRSRPPLRVVRQAPRRTRIGLIGAIGTLAVFGVLFALVVFQTMMVQNQARLDRLDAQIRDEQARYQQHRLQVAQLEAPLHIVDVATQRLGMVTPPGTGYLTPSAADAAAANAAAPDTSAPSERPADSGSDWATVKPHLGASG
jgi:type II secretory pathway pseudopilin PulG